MKRYLLRVGILASVLAFAFVFQPAALAQDGGEDIPSVEEIVERANRVAYYQGKDGRADVQMRIVDSQGRERSRRFTILRRDKAPPEQRAEEAGADRYTGDQKFYVYFKGPADVRNTVFMVWKHVDEDTDDDRWLYLPALDLVKRIAASDKRSSFVGSHFFYEDVSGRNPELDEHELADVTENYFILNNTPKKPGQVEFSRYRMWIHRDTYLPVQTEYYDDQGEAYRRYTVENVSRLQDYLTVMRSRMEDLRSGGHTIIEYSDVEYDVGIPEDIFTERYLRNPPMNYIE
ncbi:MAG: outer membrane lipoprotein-sorting protein [Desulfobacteraceae bacterium]|nr:outer membrane lipoprotein-sorting protein [Desulfobacteraceae bacterium]MCF8094182.1 outer membrane lipoprotein-sorting protein [Desulfobacteraceae bacterium]